MDDFEFLDNKDEQEYPEEATKRKPASHGRTRKAQVKKQTSSLKKRIIAFAIAEVVVLCGIFGYSFLKKQYNKIQRHDVNIDSVVNTNLSIDTLKKMEEKFWTVAVFGVDSRDSSVGVGANSDVIMLANLNRETGEIKLCSVFRDTYMGIGDGTYNKINAAYCNGGPEQALRALNEDLDLNITQYATFNWAAVATAINILGGVDIELSKAEFYYINSYITATVKGSGIGSTQLTSGGMQHLDGVQAVAYARLRYMDNDFARTERQRKVVTQCFDKLKSADAGTLMALIGNVIDMVGTNVTMEDAIEAAKDLPKYHMGDTGGFPWARGDADIGKITYCVIPQTLESNVRQLHAFLFDDAEYEPSDAVKDMSANISAKSGMYSEGQYIDHVRTDSSYIPTKKATVEEKTEPLVASLSTASTSTASVSSPGTESQEVTTIDLDESYEYSISRDGYLVYVFDEDSDGEPIYKYVLDDNGKRIKMVTTDDKGSTIYLYELGRDGKLYVKSGVNTGKISTATGSNGPGEGPGSASGSESSEGFGPGSAPGSKTTEEPSAPGPGEERKTDNTGNAPGSKTGEGAPGSKTQTATPGNGTPVAPGAEPTDSIVPVAPTP